jgi:hypothetical protein
MEQGGPLVAVPSVLGHVGLDAYGDIVIYGTNRVDLDTVAPHQRNAPVDQPLGMAARG